VDGSNTFNFVDTTIEDLVDEHVRDLVNDLKKEDRFGWARRVVTKIREGNIPSAFTLGSLSNTRCALTNTQTYQFCKRSIRRSQFWRVV
jgi:hypothetical protein